MEKKMKSGLMKVTQGTFCSLPVCHLLFQQMRNGVYLDKRPEADVYEEGLIMHDLTYHPLIRPNMLA